MRVFLFVVFASAISILGCTLSSDVSSTLPKVGMIVNVDSSGVTVQGIVASDVLSAVIENTSYAFSAVQDGGNVKLVPSQNITLTAVQSTGFSSVPLKHKLHLL